MGDNDNALLLAKVAEETSNVDSDHGDGNNDENVPLSSHRKRRQPVRLYESEDGDGKQFHLSSLNFIISMTASGKLYKQKLSDSNCLK